MIIKAAFFVLALALCTCTVSGKDDDKDPIMNYAALEKPFRMQKVNLVWDKARVKLSEGKLKVLHYELKMHDKEEVALKKLKADVGDKDGLREAVVRKKFNSILNHYGLGGKGPEEVTVDKANLRMFKDKKLDRLWIKAQQTGMQEEELLLLKREFQHYQEKLDEYHRLMEISGKDPLNQNRRKNSIDDEDDFDSLFGDENEEKLANAIDGDDHKKQLKRHYERLKRKATQVGKEFDEPKVNGLWKLAQEAEFEETELHSLRLELKHFEHSVQKLHLMQEELNHMGNRVINEKDDSDGLDFKKRMDKKMKKYAKKVKTEHEELERKIVSRHSEL